MSRWVDQFEAHAFQGAWKGLNLLINEATVDDATVITSVTELARLKKVSSYLDEMINNIDPELVPMTIWDSFQQQAAAGSQQIIAYNSNRNIGHIQNANANADNLLTYIRPYMVAAGDVGKILQKAIKNYAKTIDEYGESFRNKSNNLVKTISEYTNQSKELHDHIENTKTETDQYREVLFGRDESDGGIQSKVNLLVEDFEKKHNEIVSQYNEILVGDKNSPSTMMEILQAKESITNDQGQITTLLADVSVEVNELSKFYIKIFGKSNSDGTREGGLAGELNARTKALSDFEIKQNLKYLALVKQIEELLPGATSAGLASAYLDMKKSFDTPIKNMSLVFYVSIGLLIAASLLLAIDSVGLYYINFVKIGEWDAVLKSVVIKTPFYAPILWLAYYASKRRSEYQRLQQEYAHKEALAKSYDNYKKQIEQLDIEDIEMQKIFIMKAIDAIAYNASATLDGKHGDKMPALELVEKAVEEMLKAKNIFKYFDESKKPA